MQFVVRLTVILTLGAHVGLASAEKMDQDTHTMVIQKLESALSALSRGAPERGSITLRLADLYADRARLQNLRKNDAHCASCDDGSKDRRRALELYAQIVNHLNADRQGEVLLQMAHIQELLNQQKAAVKTLTQVVAQAKKFDGVVVARAHGALGEIEYRQGQYKKSEDSFRQALANNETPNRGFLTYRLAWAQLNQGKSEQATATLVSILKNPDLLTVQNQSGTQFDDSFHQDVAKDLVTFVARGDVGEKEISDLLALTPDPQRRDNLYSLANELERLGKKYSATLAWRAYYLEGQANPSETLETQIRVAQLQYDMGRKDQALEEFGKAADLMRKQSCEGSQKCEELRKRFKNFVVTWSKTEKERPSAGCFKAFQIYLSAVRTESDMHFKAAEVATELKHHAEASALYAQAALLARDEVNGGKDTEQRKKSQELLEAALLRQIESAEASQSPDARIAAYDNYLTLNPRGERNVEVRYQKAQVFYAKGDHQTALKQFKALATEGGTDHRDLRLKSADLTLDALVLLKDDRAIESNASDLARIYPERENEYLRIQRKAAVRLAAVSLAKKDSSESDLKEQLMHLKSTRLSGASKDERLTILKNQIVLAERTKQLDEVIKAADSILAIKGVSQDDREFALGRKAWVAEMRMDFKEGLKINRQMKLGHLSNEERQLRFAMLSELAGQDPSKYYQAALKTTRSISKANAIRATLVRLAKNPWTALNKYHAELAKSPELLSTLVLEAQSEKRNDKDAMKFANSPALKNQPVRKTLRRQELISKWQEHDRRITSHRLHTRSQALLQKTLIERISRLNDQDLLAKQAVKEQDWTSQLLIINTIARENRRLYTELMALPVPQQLKAADKKQYQTILAQKAEPFRVKADQADKKLAQFWSNDNALSEIQTAYRNASVEIQSLLNVEIRALASVAPKSQKSTLLSLLDQQKRQPTAKQVLEARRRVIHSPFDADLIQQLKDLETKLGEHTMVAFLDARLDQIKSGVKR